MNLEIVNNTLKKIKPNKKERLDFNLVLDEFLNSLNKNLQDAKSLIGGSAAKDTWLAGNHDVDIFILFDYGKYFSNSKSISDILEKVLQKSFPNLEINRVHGSRDYFRLNYKNYLFEIVPILEIDKAEQALNITDISPLHTKWVNENGEDIKDEIRLAKQFFKANGLYGAESYLSGFSGYVIEILTIFYDSFQNFLEASQRWKEKKVIDPSKFYKKDMASFHINSSKLQSPLIVVDPVDKNRNAAAALSKEKFILFKKKAKEFINNPSEEFFVKKEVTYELLKKEVGKNHLIFITTYPPEGKEDVIGAKLLKIYNYLNKSLQPFSVKKSGWEWNKEAIFYFIVGKDKLPSHEIRVGPPVDMEEFVENFKKKNKETFIENGRMMAKIEVKDPQLQKFVARLFKHKYIKEKVNKIKVKF